MGGPPGLLGRSQECGVCLSQGKMVWTGTGIEENHDWGVGIQQGPARGCRASSGTHSSAPAPSCSSFLPTLALSSAHSFYLSFCRLRQTAPVW